MFVHAKGEGKETICVIWILLAWFSPMLVLFMVMGCNILLHELNNQYEFPPYLIFMWSSLQRRDELKDFHLREIYMIKLHTNHCCPPLDIKSAIFRAQSDLTFFCVRHIERDFSHFTPTVNVVSSSFSVVVYWARKSYAMPATREPFYLSTYVCIQQNRIFCIHYELEQWTKLGI